MAGGRLARLEPEMQVADVEVVSVEEEFTPGGDDVIDRTSRGLLTVEYTGDPSIESLSGTKILFSGAALYLRPPQGVLPLPPGKEWIRGGVSSVSPTEDVPDPSQLFAYLSSAGQVEKIGEETLGGAPTTHYKAVVDLNDAQATARSEGRIDDADSAEEMANMLGSSRLPTDVWVDQNGLVCR